MTDSSLRLLTAEEVATLEADLRKAIAELTPGLDSEAALADAAGLDLWLEAVDARNLAASEELQAIGGILLARRMARDLDLEWIRDESEQELGMRSPASEIVFYPRRMVLGQVGEWQSRSKAEEPGAGLSYLVASTRDYLRNLLRFHPSQARP